MDTFDTYSLTLFQAGYKLRISTLLALLNGKKTATVMTFAYFYRLEAAFATVPELRLERLDAALARLVKSEFLERKGNFAWVTAAGQAELQRQSRTFLTFLPNGIKRIPQEKNNWQLFLLAMQALSNYSYHQKQFLPIVQQEYLQARFKQWFQKNKGHAQFILQIKQEFDQLIMQLPPTLQPFFVERLTGYQVSGKTLRQLQVEWSKEPDELELYESLTRRIVLAAVQQESEYPLLSDLLTSPSDLAQRKRQRTVELFQTKTTDISQLAALQSIRPGTVFDHLLEAFLTENLPLNSLLSEAATDFFHAVEKASPVDVRLWEYAALKTQNPTLDFTEFRVYQLLKVQEGGDRGVD